MRFMLVLMIYYSYKETIMLHLCLQMQPKLFNKLQVATLASQNLEKKNNSTELLPGCSMWASRLKH